MNNTDTNRTLFKTYAVGNYVHDYYKKLKKSLPRKIENGEIEWIYSYGEKLIKVGQRTVLKKVRELAKTGECENDFIDSDLLYERCVQISKKFWWII